MMINDISEIDQSKPYKFIIGDCAVKQINKSFDNDEVYSMQIQSGKGHYQLKYDELKNCTHIYFFVSWGNAISVTENEQSARDRMKIHKTILIKLLKLNCPILFVDRHGFLDRYCPNLTDQYEKHGHGIDHNRALSLGWRPQSLIEQIKRRLKYREELIPEIDNLDYYDLFDYVGVTTYRNESGECKKNIVNTAPWHYDMPSYSVAADAFKLFIAGELDETFFIDWERHVIFTRKRMAKNG